MSDQSQNMRMSAFRIGNIQEDLPEAEDRDAIGVAIHLLNRGADEIDRLCTQEDEYERTIDGMDKIIAGLREQLVKSQDALRDIERWKDDTLGPRPKKFGPFDCDPSISSAFDRGVRMAFYRCAERARAALSDEKSK